MKKLLFLSVTFIALSIISLGVSGCKDGKKDNEAVEDSLNALAANDSINEDTAIVQDNTPLSEMEKLMGEKPMPKAADEFFDDFFFNFSNNRKIQKERIQWPLTAIENGVKKTIKANQWQTERFFNEDGFYVMLLDDAKQTNLAKDTSLTHVAVNHVDIPRNKLEVFTFNRLEGKWMMTEMEEESLSESKNANFLKFYQKFATDSIYCQESLAETITFTGPDEEDENLTTTRNISAEEYCFFAPELATEFYTITYGQKNESSTNKVFIMREPSSSQECRLYFRRQGANWKLYKLEE
ncbi:MAG: DUF4348 domain-containing protein [Bacteroidaceae bacterium]|nr:DUF4348 domain-containing protein [Bacteroidaceae bacterium]